MAAVFLRMKEDESSRDSFRKIAPALSAIGLAMWLVGCMIVRFVTPAPIPAMIDLDNAVQTDVTMTNLRAGQIHVVQAYHVGETVDCKDNDYNPWMECVVTSLTPLELKPLGWHKSWTFKQVRKLSQVSKLQYDISAITGQLDSAAIQHDWESVEKLSTELKFLEPKLREANLVHQVAVAVSNDNLTATKGEIEKTVKERSEAIVAAWMRAVNNANKDDVEKLIVSQNADTISSLKQEIDEKVASATLDVRSDLASLKKELHDQLEAIYAQRLDCRYCKGGCGGAHPLARGAKSYDHDPGSYGEGCAAGLYSNGGPGEYFTCCAP